MDERWLLKISKKLSPRRRKAQKQFLTDGMRPPERLLHPKFGKEHFGDPETWLRRLFAKDKPAFEAVLKGRLQCLQLGALAGPLVGADPLVYGRRPVWMPEFTLDQNKS